MAGGPSNPTIMSELSEVNDYSRFSPLRESCRSMIPMRLVSHQGPNRAADSFWQRRPSGDDFRQIRVKCVGFCAALLLIGRISRGMWPWFESLRAYSRHRPTRPDRRRQAREAQEVVRLSRPRPGSSTLTTPGGVKSVADAKARAQRNPTSLVSHVALIRKTADAVFRLRMDSKRTKSCSADAMPLNQHDSSISFTTHFEPVWYSFHVVGKMPVSRC